MSEKISIIILYTKNTIIYAFSDIVLNAHAFLIYPYWLRGENAV